MAFHPYLRPTPSQGQQEKELKERFAQVAVGPPAKGGPADDHGNQRPQVERNNFKCPRCHKAHHPENSPLLLCDSCPRSYHLICLDVTFEELPEEEWQCPKCQDRKLGTGRRSSANQAQAEPYDRSGDAELQLSHGTLLARAGLAISVQEGCNH